MTEPEETSRSDAHETLMRAIDSLDSAEADYGEAKRTYLVVCWAHQVDGQTVRGWNATDDPDFVTTALLRDVASWIESRPVVDDTPEEEEDQ